MTLSSAIFVLFAGYAGRNAFNFHPVTPEFNLSDPDFDRHHRKLLPPSYCSNFLQLRSAIRSFLFEFVLNEGSYPLFIVVRNF